MSTIRQNSIVNRQEADALKEMIFKRVRERAELMNNTVQESYTTTVKNDIMELARESFVSNKNPFSVEDKENITKKEVNNDERTPEIGFPPRHAEQIKKNSTIKSEEISQATVHSNMNDARQGFEKRSSFTGALDFLNSQGAISLMKTKNKKFEIVA